MNITILGGIIWGCLFFKHKTDESIRNLYIENIKQLDKIFSKFFSLGKLDEETRRLIFEVCENASLYLHKDIVNYISKIKDLIFEHELLNCQLRDDISGEKRNKICDREYYIMLELFDLADKSIGLYRKQILYDGFIPQIEDKYKEFRKKLEKKEHLELI